MHSKANFFLLFITLPFIFHSQPNANHDTHNSVSKKVTVLLKAGKGSKPPSECLEGLVESYGMVSTGDFSDQMLTTCPSSNRTCCTFESQKLMIIQMQVDSKNIDRRFEAQDKIIFDLLDELQLDMRYIERFKTRQLLKRISSCGAIATKLSFHDIDRVKASLRIHRQEMREWAIRSHKGIYCAMCNAETQKFINLDRNIVKVSFKFCRSIVVNTIQPMMYLHYEFKKFLNLMLKFLTNCDEHGSYRHISPPDFLELEYSNWEKTIRECWDMRNDPDWSTSCYNYCKEYDITQFKEFFEPNLDRFLKLTYYFKRQRMMLNVIERNDVMLNEDTSVSDVELNPHTIPLIHNADVADEDSEEDSWREEDLDALKRPLSKIEMKVFLTRFVNKRIVAGDIGSNISLSDFKLLYINKGIDFEELGRDAVATDNLLKSVITKMDALKTGSNAIIQGVTQVNTAAVQAQIASGAAGANGVNGANGANGAYSTCHM